ncbi:zf-HC2 domain-containing protein [Egicoccus sp. AB-alg2]|uniref:zf-HC2 domain-containing protein n=1 Tax=Egicoccus sp. AB-alg2 TaxID=3242693 RepID=UPI00359D4FFE
MTPAMGCADAVRNLWEYLDGELARHDHDALEAHLDWCRRCCGELALAEELRSLLTDRTTTDVPVDVLDRLETFVAGLHDDDGKVHG